MIARKKKHAPVAEQSIEPDDEFDDEPVSPEKKSE
jgi:hypothetical protein